MKLNLWLLMIMLLGRRERSFNIIATTSHYGVQKILAVDGSNVYGQSLNPEGALSRNVIASPVERFPYQNIVVEYRYTVAGNNRFRRYTSLGRLLLALPFILTPLHRWGANIKHFLGNVFLNRRPTETRERYDLLKYIVAHKAVSETPFTLNELMAEMVGYLCFTQEDRNWHLQKMKYQLASLVETHDLEMTAKGQYKVTGLAWKSLSDFQEENRRHRDSARIQWIMVLLTMAIGLFALSNTGAVRLPLLVDLQHETRQAKNFVQSHWQSLLQPDEPPLDEHKALEAIMMLRTEPHIEQIHTLPKEESHLPLPESAD
ncbi:hypothetical protein [Methylobacillus flagellatus]|uniref:Uncharacterized protein n=1 Tax=Methylobacillus flagellatus (strain ATCC 51484 / DSM 6875 / VKM B-1610 / KT) TaxID=265072 RepID=Q1H1Q1_METFK|nr:hypothetical protein [Methylobacillus flagellatus]ABE49586.1 hypothetical protein Mfla_1318 [Methylobacillus flagellatus KT]